MVDAGERAVTPAESDQQISTALLAAAEALHHTVHSDPASIISVLSWRSDAVDSIVGQVGVQEFHALLADLTDSVCAFLRDQAQRVIG